MKMVKRSENNIIKKKGGEGSDILSLYISLMVNKRLLNGFVNFILAL